MNAMILAAGFGTRLLPFTKKLPKPLFPIIDKTLLDIAIETARNAGAEKIVINAHHLASMIEDHVAGLDYGVEVVVLVESEIMGTAGGIKNAEAHLDDKPFFVLNSDMLFKPDFKALAKTHDKTGALSTLVLRKNPPKGNYGVLSLGKTGRVTKFLDTKSPDYAPSEELMFTGVSLLSPDIFEKLAKGRPSDISTEVYAPMVKESGPLYGLVSKAEWIDVGTVSDYHKAVMSSIHPLELSPAAAWSDLKGFTAHDPVYIESGVDIGNGAVIGPHVTIHKEAIIGEGARIKECIILPGSTVPPGATIEGEVV